MPNSWCELLATIVSIAGRTVLIEAEDDDGGNGVADSEASASGIVIDGDRRFVPRGFVMGLADDPNAVRVVQARL